MSKNSYAVQALCQKMRNPDADLRFMALTDLISDIKKSGQQFGVDDATEHTTVEQVLQLMNDSNTEVKNLAVKALAALIKHVTDQRIQTIIDRLIALTSSKDEGIPDIASLGLKTLVQEVTPASHLATLCCNKLAPKVFAQLENPSSTSELVMDCLDLVADMFSRFESTIRSNSSVQTAAVKATVPLLSHTRPAVRKRAIMTLSTIVTASGNSKLLDDLIDGPALNLLQSSKQDSLKTGVALVGSLTRSVPNKMGKKAKDVLPLVIDTLSVNDDDELKEGGLQALEAFALKCPTDSASFFQQFIQAGTTWLKYDPNYAGDDEEDDDVEMGTASDDDEIEDEDDYGEDYTDDDDTSWKVRRASAKLLSSCISTKSRDMLSSFYQNISPVVIARFNEREETVRLEIWSMFTVLLTQTKMWGQSTRVQTSGLEPGSSASSSSSGKLKRKRSSDQMDVEEGPISQLRSQTPAIVKSIVKQLSTKSLPMRQAGFLLLHELIDVLEGGLESQINPLVTRIEASLKTSDGGLSGAATSLKIEILSFLGLLFRTHPIKSFHEELNKLVPLLVSTIGDRFNKIASEAFTTTTELVRILRPVQPSVSAVSSSVSGWLINIYEATSKRLVSTDADEEVKSKGIICLGALLYHAGDVLNDGFEQSLNFLRDRLKNEVSRLIAVKVVGEVAESPVCQNSKFDKWIEECLIEVSTLLRKVHRPLKVTSFKCLKSLLNRHGDYLISDDTLQVVANELQPLLSDVDINLLPLALQTSTVVLTSVPTSFNIVTNDLLPQVLELARSPLLQGQSLETLLDFFKAYVKSGAQPLDLIESFNKMAQDAQLVTSSQNGSQGSMNSGDNAGVVMTVQSLGSASRCISVVVQEALSVADGVIQQYANVVNSKNSSPAALTLGLLTLGEIGRSVDFAPYNQIFPDIVTHFSSTSEDVRRSAAFAAGNIAVGDLKEFLPTLLNLIQSDEKKRYLALQALKQVILHSRPQDLATVSEQLWTPLFENSAAQDEATRSVAADCLGQLTVIDPVKYLPQLQSRLKADSRDIRATVISAIRFTFTNESSTTYDELLSPLIVEFFELLQDQDLGVRRSTLSALNSVSHNKPHLVREHLNTLLPQLYEQTEPNESLVRVVVMGPFKHRVDDGLDLRKTAYECMHTLLDSCVKDFEVDEFLDRVVAGLKDEEEVKKLCYLMLTKLSHLTPLAVSNRLDDTVPSFTETLQTTLKENSVKQDLERLAELQKAALRCMIVLQKRSSQVNTPKFCNMIQTIVVNGRFANDWKELSSTIGQYDGLEAMQE
ncbi:hypothetical protein OIO90_001922 [Microbotryomycetes sp. JL221]|nr:hypothetical protein OIO90_001922 [Microbotryomycetes sp. JL221]